MVTNQIKKSGEVEIFVYGTFQNAVDQLSEAARVGDWKIITQAGIHTVWETKDGDLISVMARKEGGWRLK